MSRTLYGFLVAIDQYRPPVPPLRGCVNDIEAVRELLEDFAANGEYKLELRVLKDAAATRVGVIDGFREHLSRAGGDDVVLFYYSGHGSQEDAPPEFWHIEPDRLNETLVCYDSRDDGQWDLADKELAVLIEEIARRDPHILCVLDCCHSGSGTRAPVDEGIAVRRAPTDRRHRPVETFLAGAMTIASPHRGRSLGAGWDVIPSGKHVLLAACRSSETAKETRESGKSHGAFTAALLAALRQTRGSITYRDLLKRAEALVRLRVAQQVPQIEASEPGDLQRLFLGGAVRQQRAHFTLRRDKELGWVIDGGAVHGIVPPTGGETTILAVFDLQTVPTDWRQLDAAVATAEVNEVRPELSRVRLQIRSDRIDEASTYRAVVIGTPLPALSVYLQGQPDALERVRSALAVAGEDGGPSTFVRAARTEDEAELRVDAEAGSFRISRAASERPMIAEIVGFGEDGAKTVVQRLEHISRWEAIARLENPGSRFGATPVEIIIHQAADHDGKQEWRETDPRHGIRLEYGHTPGGWQQPRIRIELKNNGPEDVYCALLWLGENYSVSSELNASGAVLIPKERAIMLNNGEPIWGFVPDEQWREGRTEVHDLLKLIVSTEQFDPTLLDQQELDRYVVTRTGKAIARAPSNALDRLSARIHRRGLSTRPGAGETRPEWATSTLVVSVVRPLDAAQVPGPGRKQALGAGITMIGHPSLKAKVRLVSPTEAGRALGAFALPAILRDDPDKSQPFLFEAPRGADSGLGAIHLFDVQNPETVSAEAPLLFRIEANLDPGEHILPFAWDGEFFVPLGLARPIDDGVEIELQRLPEPIQTANDVERGIISSVRILFQKLLSSKLGTDYDYPHLALVNFNSKGVPDYDAETSALCQAVAQANRILLYVHGMLGDTLAMTASSRTEIHSSNLPSRRIGERYDLILAFDYENINTGIKLTAQKLGERLASIGLGPCHGKTLHVAAHSMGGLVVRWFIEREGGSQVVQRLVTLGTPHAGSPWPKIQDWATAAIALGLNGLTQIAWPVKVLADLMGAVEIVDVMLDEMAPTSPLLTELEQSIDPKVPYALLVGNTSIIEAATDGGRLERLLSKISPQKTLHAATSLAFLRAPNDIAVSVTSAKAVPRGRVPDPYVAEVACDHVTFFSSDAGLKALLAALD